MSKAGRTFYLQLGGVLLVITLLLAASRFLPIVDLISRVQGRVMQWGVWSAVCYPLLFGLCNLLLLPGGILSVGGGFFFGLWWGFGLVMLGNCAAAAVSFGLSRSVGRQWLERKLSGHPTLRRLGPAVEHEGWKIIFLSQLHPLFPTSLLNYLYGLTRIRFGTYILWTTLGRAPGLFLYTYLGTLGQFGLNVAKGKSHPRLVEYWTWGGAFVTTVVLFLLLTRIALEAIRHPRHGSSVRPIGETSGQQESHPLRPVES
jgi:uncharacterized membrane protein YdjX (TVP38/TMEM64 family)